jgi:pantoate--beta-alanine ligase
VRIARTIADLRPTLARLRLQASIGFVPTMGAWHRGHVGLIHAARRRGCAVVASIFVNPAQFNDPADLAGYPRQEARDATLAVAEGVDVLFVPTADEVYPTGFASWVDVYGEARGFEGDLRPGHFRGVATVCLKLFHIVAPDIAFFGQKDAQQVAVIGQLVRDLNMPIEIATVPTVRDADGVALSSRNVRLSPDERRRARAIPRALTDGLAAHRAGEDPVAAARRALNGMRVDYLAVAEFNGRRTLAVAARVGAVRLIDNAPLDDLSTAPLDAVERAATGLIVPDYAADSPSLATGQVTPAELGRLADRAGVR